jgi:hypothetical protein
MKKLLCLYLALVSATMALAAPADTAKQFLSHLYGAEVDLAAICHPNDDLWMLRGVPNPAGQAAIAATEVKVAATGVFAGLIEHDFCVVEMRDGKVDARLNLDTAYSQQHQLILQFLYFSLLQDKKELTRRVTNVGNVSFGRVKAASPGDMDVYQNVLELLPTRRASTPAQDRNSQSITYFVPLGKNGFLVKLVKPGAGPWKVDTSAKTVVPLELFWE